MNIEELKSAYHESNLNHIITDPYDAITIETLLKHRSMFRECREWALADRIYNHLIDIGVSIHDSGNKSYWRIKSKGAG